MDITRISQFRAHEGQGDALRDHFRPFLPAIAATEGCRSCQLLQDEEDPTRIVIIETWESIEAHKESLKRIPPSAMEDTMKLLAERPAGSYYHS